MTSQALRAALPSSACGEVGFGQLAGADLAGTQAAGHLVGGETRRRAVRHDYSLPGSAADDRRDDDVIAVAGGRVGERLVHAERRTGHVFAEDVLELDRLGGRRDGVGVELGQDRELVEDVVELAFEARQLVVREAEPGKVGDVLDVGTSEGSHGWR